MSWSHKNNLKFLIIELIMKQVALYSVHLLFLLREITILSILREKITKYYKIIKFRTRNHGNRHKNTEKAEK